MGVAPTTGGGPPAAVPAYVEAPTDVAPTTGGGPPTAMPAYIETPKDVGQAPPITPAAVSGEAAAAAPVPVTSDAESDLAALMAELDKIGSEVVKKPSKAGTSGPDAEPAKEEGKSS